jgi:hypothetical protein
VVNGLHFPPASLSACCVFSAYSAYSAVHSGWGLGEIRGVWSLSLALRPSATGLEVGLLVNFGRYLKTELERIVAERGRYDYSR